MSVFGRVCWLGLAGFVMTFLSPADEPVFAQQIIAHRGGSYEAPENTLAAFRLAWERGADGIEGDFYLTRDGYIVCIHDDTTQRTTNRNLPVAASSREQLRALDAGSWKADRFHAERIPTIEEVLAVVPSGKTVLLEVKCGPEIVPRLKTALETGPLPIEQARVIAFDRDVVQAVKQQLPQIKAFWLVGYRRDKATGQWTPSPQEVLDTLRAIGADGLDTQANVEVVDSALVTALRAAGREFHVWTVDDPAIARHFQRLGVDSITTNRPDLIRQGLLSPGLRDHLQVHLALDGNLHDQSGHQRHGTWLAENGVEIPYATGVFGQSLDLGACDAAVAVDYVLPDAGSICLWYRTVPWYDYQTVFDNACDENSWEMWIYRDGLLRFRDHPQGTAVQFRFQRTGDVHEWHHLAVTWDRGRTGDDAVCLYVNGHLSQAAPWNSRTWVTPGKRVYLGGGHSGNTRGRGGWDDVAVFDTVLRGADIAAIMMDGVAAATIPLLSRRGKP